MVIVRSLLGSILATLVASLLFGLYSSGWQPGGSIDWIAAYIALVFGIAPAALLLPLIRALSLGLLVSRGYPESLAGVIGVGSLMVVMVAVAGLVIVLKALPSVSNVVYVSFILIACWLTYCLFVAATSRGE